MLFIKIAGWNFPGDSFPLKNGPFSWGYDRKKGEPRHLATFRTVGFTGHSLAQPWRDDLIPGPTHLREEVFF